MPIGDSLPNHSVIVPRKGVIELMRMLDGGETPLRVQIGSNNIRAHVGDFVFTSKLVDGRFPDYRRVLPKNPDKTLEAGCDILKQAFARAAILSNEKFRGVRLYVSENQIKITANNPEQEEAKRFWTSPMPGPRWKSALTSATCWMCKCTEMRECAHSADRLRFERTD
jgi:DNA polymerase-3 subunit beta